MKVLYVGYSWAADRRIDSYQQSIVDALVNAGHEVHLVLGNYLAAYEGIFGFAAEPNLLAHYINGNQIDLVLCKNNAGNSSELRRLTSCPYVTWTSDEFSHIFKPDGEDAAGFSRFIDERTRFYVTTSECERFYKKSFPAHSDRVKFVPHCTRPEVFRGKRVEKTIDVSFVGSSLDFSPVHHLLMRYARPGGETVYSGILAAVQSLKTSYDCDFESIVSGLGLASVLREEGMPLRKFKMFCMNLISNNERFQTLSVLSDFNTAIFGNMGWLDSVGYSTEIAKEFRPWHEIKTFDDLVGVYQSSKISFSIPQHHVGAAIQCRVLDIMASDSLLVMKHFEASDLNRIFGPDCPVPTYRDPEELRKLCKHFLSNEEDRKERVSRCQALINESFTFDYRLRQIFGDAGLSFESSRSGRIVRPEITSFFRRTPLHLRLKGRIRREAGRFSRAFRQLSS